MRNCEGLCHFMWQARQLLLPLWTILHAVRGIFSYISYLLSVCCCYFMYFSNYSSNCIDISVVIIQPHIFFVHMDTTKDLRLLLPLSSVLCQKSSMSTSPNYTYQSLYCQSISQTTVNIIWFQVSGSIIF